MTAQTKRIDELRRAVYTADNNDQKLAAIIKLCDDYKSLPRDSLDQYAVTAKELAQQTTNKNLQNGAALVLAYSYVRWGWIDSTLAIVEPLIKENHVNDAAARPVYFKATRLKAMSLAMHSRYEEALKVFYRIVKEAELYKDSLTYGENINTIGSISLARNEPKQALALLYQALAFSTNEERYAPTRAAVYVNMADAFNQLKKPDSANFYIEKGIGLFKELQNLINLAIALQRQASIFTAAGNFDKAETALREMITVRKQSGDSAVYVDDNLALADFYLQSNQVDKAIQICLDRLQKGDVHDSTGGKVYANAINIRLEYYQLLARCYKIKGNTEMYQQVLENIIAAKDSFYLTNSAVAIAEMQAKYDLQKKENTIIQQKLDLTKKNNRFYAVSAVACFIVALLLLMFFYYRKREKLKLSVALEKEKLIAVQAVTRAEEKERKRIAADLHDSLGVYAAAISSNLDQLSLRQPGEEKMAPFKELRNNSQAIIAQLSDTIWALKKDAQSLTSISDRLKVFMLRMQPSYPAITMDVTEDIATDHLLSSLQAFHLFQVLQEAINNALRHSRCDHIKIAITGNDSWSVRVSDNGKGIDENSIHATGGNGIENMKHRAKAQGLFIEWKNNNPGTVIAIYPQVDGNSPV